MPTAATHTVKSKTKKGEKGGMTDVTPQLTLQFTFLSTTRRLGGMSGSQLKASSYLQLLRVGIRLRVLRVYLIVT